MNIKVPWILLFWCCAAAILVLALLPSGTPVPSTGWDKSNHLLAFGVLTSIGRLAFPKLGGRLVVFMISYGILIELMQAMTPSRSAELGDVIADALGAAFGYFVASHFIKSRR